MENMRNVRGKLSDTAATASAPSLPTQKVSVSWYTVCRRLAKIMGMDNEKMDLIIDPSVRSGSWARGWDMKRVNVGTDDNSIPGLIFCEVLQSK